MPRDREDLSTSQSERDPDLEPGFTYEELKNELWADIESVFPSVGLMEKGDITIEEFAQKQGVHRDTAMDRMKALAASGGWEYIDVRRPGDNKKIKVLRRVTTS